jgi:hypothetical protein
MMASILHDVRPSFAAGELAPALASRTDFAKYASGAKTLRNFFVHPTGGASNRPGTLYVASTKDSSKRSRLVDFQFSTDQAYILEFGDLYIRFYRDGGQILSGENPYEIATPYLEADLPLLKFTQSADTLYIAHKDYAPRTLIRTADDDWTLDTFNFINGPYMPPNDDATHTIVVDEGTVFNGYQNITLTSNVDMWVDGDVGSWFRCDADIEGTVLYDSATLVDEEYTSGVVMAYRQWRATTTGTWNGTVDVQAYADGAWVTIATMSSSNDHNYDTYGSIPYDYPVRIRLLATLNGGSGSVNVTLRSDAFQYSYNFLVMSRTSSKIVVVKFVEAPIVSFWPFTASNWSYGSWSSVRGWPSVVNFYQDRLGWASSPSEPQALWLSKTGDYVNHGVTDPLVDSDAISINLPSRKMNTVKNLLSLNKLLPLTSSAEFGVGPGSSGVLSPTSLDVRPHGYRGSSSVDAVVVGNQGVYVQPMGTVIRSIGYQFVSDSFTGDNLNILSSHLFENYSITDLAYAQEPDSLVWALRSDGVLLSMTYLPEQQVIAWTWHDTDGTVESIAVIPNSTDGYDELWMIVNRDNGRFVERMPKRLLTFDVEDQIHLDCAISYDSTPATVISGLDHLEGQSVMALADGSVQGPFTVVGGSITLTVASSLVHIGLPYVCDLETLNVEAQMNDGTAQSRKQRTPQVVIRFLHSVGGYVGASSARLRPIFQRTNEALGSPVELKTQDYKVTITPDWSTHGRVFFRQTDPLPVTILGIYPFVELSNL